MADNSCFIDTLRHIIHLYYIMHTYHFTLLTSKICLSGTQDLYGAAVYCSATVRWQSVGVECSGIGAIPAHF